MGSGKYFVTQAVAAVFLLAGAAQSTAAADLEDGWDRFQLQVSMFRPDINSEVRLDPVTGPFGTFVAIFLKLVLQLTNTYS